MAYLSGKNISIASPILDASLPDGSRVQLTYGSEVTRRGSTFTIRRFRVDPLTISDLIALKTIPSEMAAYLWYVIENRASVLVAGVWLLERPRCSTACQCSSSPK
jgi:flagellar protein FlaI